MLKQVVVCLKNVKVHKVVCTTIEIRINLYFYIDSNIYKLYNDNIINGERINL